MKCSNIAFSAASQARRNARDRLNKKPALGSVESAEDFGDLAGVHLSLSKKKNPKVYRLKISMRGRGFAKQGGFVYGGFVYFGGLEIKTTF